MDYKTLNTNKIDKLIYIKNLKTFESKRYYYLNK